MPTEHSRNPRRKTKAEKTHKLDDDAEEPTTKPSKAQKLLNKLDTLDRIIYTAPSPKETSPSPEAITDENVQSLNRQLLAIHTNSKTVPSFSQASSVSFVTEGGLTTCEDGGQNFERLFLENNFHRAASRSYSPRQSVLERVRKDLNADGTKLRSAANSTSFFIPCTALYSIMSQETVGLLLQECYPNENLGRMTKEVLAPLSPDAISFRRAFAILILIQKQAQLRWFFEKNIDDSQLPFDSDAMNHPLADFSELVRDWNWETEDFRKFCQVRLEISPVFFAVSEPGKTEKIVHYQCRPGEVLPFVEYYWTVKGGFGEVTSYKLHEDQQNLHRYTKEGASRAIAVKKLYRADGDKEFKQEYDILDRLTHLRTPHIAKLLGSYEIPKRPGSQEYFLMFECADMPLSELWTKDPGQWAASLLSETEQQKLSEFPAPFPPEEIARWAAIQAYGLAKALMQLHNFGPHRKADDVDGRTHGLHGDLKPDNVLHYKNWKNVDEKLGVLQITDFGLSSFHYTQSADDIVLRRGTNVYRPPEAAVLSPLSASFDTWSLGCLFIEFLTWLVRGPAGLESFRQRRLHSPGFAPSSFHACFWEVAGKDEYTIVSLSRVVITWAIEIYDDANSSQFVRDFSELIINQMLVIEKFEKIGIKGESMGEPAQWSKTRPETKGCRGPATRRITTGELAKVLKSFKTQGSEYFKPSPSKRPHNLQEEGHCIMLPQPLYQINKDARARHSSRLPSMPGMG